MLVKQIGTAAHRDL